MTSTPLRLVPLTVALLLATGARPAAAEGPATPPSAAPAAGTAAAAAPAALSALAGRWTVDLRPSPDAPKYDKAMVLAIGADRAVSGSFYDSEIQAGRASASNGRVCFSIRTTDGIGPYHTSGCLVGDRILGQTWAEHRGFVLNWAAVRE
ncbi:MAG: hypothetical protein U0229_12525 [Anaeromyxobacter sp.]